MAEHQVRTTHIQHLIENGLRHARVVNGKAAGEHVVLVGNTNGSVPEQVITVEGALEKAAADLRHAAEELTAERLSLLGYPQV